MKLKVIGHVDLKTGICYDNNSKIIPKQGNVLKEDMKDVEERLKRRRGWLAGEFSYFP